MCICKVKRSYRKAVDFLLPLFVTFVGNRKYVLVAPLTIDIVKHGLKFVCLFYFFFFFLYCRKHRYHDDQDEFTFCIFIFFKGTKRYRVYPEHAASKGNVKMRYTKIKLSIRCLLSNILSPFDIYIFRYLIAN